MTDFEAIPDFLRLTAEKRKAAWRGVKLTTMRKDTIDRTVKKRQRQTTKGMKEHYAALKQRREKT
jgi:hypothetical protein